MTIQPSRIDEKNCARAAGKEGISAIDTLTRHATHLISEHALRISSMSPIPVSLATFVSANRSFERSVKFGTDLPVAQSATG